MTDKTNKKSKRLQSHGKLAKLGFTTLLGRRIRGGLI